MFFQSSVLLQLDANTFIAAAFRSRRRTIGRRTSWNLCKKHRHRTDCYIVMQQIRDDKP